MVVIGLKVVSMSRIRRISYHGWVLLLGCLWVLYLISPIDLFPDGLPVLGWLDDLMVLAGVYWFIRRLRPYAVHSARGSSSASYAGARTHTGTEEAQAERPRAAETSRSEDPWQVLEIKPGASQEEIHAAYKVQLLKYHPDRVAHLGEEFQHLAYSKTLAIQQAYATLKQHEA